MSPLTALYFYNDFNRQCVIFIQDWCNVYEKHEEAFSSFHFHTAWPHVWLQRFCEVCLWGNAFLQSDWPGEGGGPNSSRCFAEISDDAERTAYQWWFNLTAQRLIPSTLCWLWRKICLSCCGVWKGTDLWLDVEAMVTFEGPRSDEGCFMYACSMTRTGWDEDEANCRTELVVFFFKTCPRSNSFFTSHWT